MASTNKRPLETETSTDIDSPIEKEDTLNSCDESENDSAGESDELLYTKTKHECTLSDNEEDSDDDSQGDFDEVDAEFDCFDPSERFYHGIRHFFVESILVGLDLREKTPKKKGADLATVPLSNDDNAKSAISNDASESVVQERTTDDAASQTTRVGQNETPKIIAAPLASRLADCVCEQGNIGTVLCIPGDDTESNAPVGFATILNIDQYFDQGLKEIKHALLNAARKRLEPRHFRIFKSIIDARDEEEPLSRNKIRLLKKRGIPLPTSAGGKRPVVGLFLNERLVNLPPQLVPTLLENLSEDIRWSQTTPSCPEHERPHYFFTHIIGLSHCFVVDPDADEKKSEEKAESRSLKKKKKRNSDTHRGSLPQKVFRKFEDEVYVKHSDFYFTIPTSLTSRVELETTKTRRRPRMADAPEHRLVFVLPYNKLPVVIRECKQLIDDGLSVQKSEGNVSH